jgi:hypothetical protein
VHGQRFSGAKLPTTRLNASPDLALTFFCGYGPVMRRNQAPRGEAGSLVIVEQESEQKRGGCHLYSRALLKETAKAV